MSASSHLHALLTEPIIRKLAGPTYYQRGVDYLRRDLVESLRHSDGRIEAVVNGTDDYIVTLSVHSTRLQYTCECPLGDDGAFCKHCVAAALAWLAQQDTQHMVHRRKVSSRKVTDAEIRQALLAQEKETLVAWLCEWSKENDTLKRRLITLACLRNDPETAAAALRLELKNAIQIRRFVEYREAATYAGRVEAALDAVEAFLRQGHAEPVICLCESAMKFLEAALDNLDDSDGQGTELMERIAALHFAACEQAKPDPRELGTRLFSLDVNAHYGQWNGIAERYKSLLGEEGVAAYKAAAAAAWALSPFAPVEKANTKAIATSPSPTSWSRLPGNRATWSSSSPFLNATLRRPTTISASRMPIAMPHCMTRPCTGPNEAWPNIPIVRVQPCVWWPRTSTDAWSAMPMPSASYGLSSAPFPTSKLISGSRPAHVRPTIGMIGKTARSRICDAAWRKRMARRSNPHESIFSHSPGHSLLVEIHLHDRNLDEAWREAQTGGCQDRLWLQLAAERERTHPQDAAEVYTRLGEQYAAAVKNGRYEYSIDLLTKAAALMQRLGRSPEFQIRMDIMRLRLKAKRNLQKAAEASRHLLYLP
jgi:hypothetical protein